jgi:hypothetical protein
MTVTTSRPLGPEASPLEEHAASRAAWAVHNAAASKARQVGACWQCCAEVGCRATDAAGMFSGPRVVVQMHAGCAVRIARGSTR